MSPVMSLSSGLRSRYVVPGSAIPRNSSPRYKASVPIWKKEFYDDEGAAWKANKEWDPAGLAREIRAPPAA